MPTIRGDLILRACDHQALAKIYIGEVAPEVDPRTGFPDLRDVAAIEPDQTMTSCEGAQAQQRR